MNLLDHEQQDLIDTEAEQMTLGAMLKSAEQMDEVLSIVSEADFSFSRHIKLFSIAKEMYDQNRLDFQTLKHFLRENGLLEEVGGIEYIAQLKLSVPTHSGVRYYAERVREQAIRRRALQLAEDIHHMTLDMKFESVEEYISAISSKFGNLEMTKKGNIVVLKDVMVNHIDQKMQAKTKSSPLMGFGDIDRWMNGIGRDRLIIVAARPGTGKTALSLKIGRKVAEQDFGPAAFFSLEMGKEELIDRMLSDIAAVPFSKIMTNTASDQEKEKMLKAADKLYHLPMYIDDSSRMDMPYISAQCRKLKREHGQLGVVVIDYLGLIELGSKKNENKSDAIGRITKECKNLAREIGCSLILLAQMNREIDKRGTKRPVLSDLRDSGNIEQDADMVIFLHRDDEKTTANMAHVDFLVAKGRQTGMRDFELTFYGDYQRIGMKVN